MEHASGRKVKDKRHLPNEQSKGRIVFILYVIQARGS